MTAWGDSVMLGARYALAFDIPGVLVDAVVGRQAGSLPSGMTQLRRLGELGRKVVIHVGDNGLFLRSTLDTALNELSDRTRVVLVTVRVPRRWQDPVNSLLRSVAAAHQQRRASPTGTRPPPGIPSTSSVTACTSPRPESPSTPQSSLTPWR